MKYSFACKNCGKLHTSDDAAEASHPHSCKVCGTGVHFSTDPGQLLAQLRAQHGDHQNFVRANVAPGYHKLVDHTNWEVLADLPAERLLFEFGLTANDVEPHVQWAKGEQRAPKVVDVVAVDNLVTNENAHSE